MLDLKIGVMDKDKMVISFLKTLGFNIPVSHNMKEKQ
jgi:hypothetical protein